MANPSGATTAPFLHQTVLRASPDTRRRGSGAGQVEVWSMRREAKAGESIGSAASATGYAISHTEFAVPQAVGLQPLASVQGATSGLASESVLIRVHPWFDSVAALPAKFSAVHQMRL